MRQDDPAWRSIQFKRAERKKEDFFLNDGACKIMKVVSLVAAMLPTFRGRAKEGQDQPQNCNLHCPLPKSGYTIIISRSGCSSP